MRRSFLPLVLLLMIATQFGCTRFMVFDLRGAASVNPIRWPTPDPKQDSQVMPVRIFQLKAKMPLNEVILAEFLGSQSKPKCIEKYLAKPQEGIPADKDYSVVREDGSQPPLHIEQIQLLKETTHLLIVAAGHGKADYSVRIIEAAPDTTVPICIDTYDVMLNVSKWQCSKRDLGMPNE